VSETMKVSRNVSALSDARFREEVKLCAVLARVR
jgi:hypothetical protein